MSQACESMGAIEGELKRINFVTAGEHGVKETATDGVANDPAFLS